MANATLAVSARRAAEVRDLVLAMDQGIDARALAEGLAGRG